MEKKKIDPYSVDFIEIGRLLSQVNSAGGSDDMIKYFNQCSLVSVFLKEKLKKERMRIWGELCKGQGDGAFSTTLELEADDIYDMIFENKTIKI